MVGLVRKIDITTSIDQGLISKPVITIFDTITLTFQILPGVGGLRVVPCSSVSSTGDDNIVVFWSWIWQRSCWRWSCLPECGCTETSLELEEELHSGQRHGLPSSDRSYEWGVDIEEEDLKINFKPYSDLTFAGLGVALCNYRPPFENWKQQKVLNLWKRWQNQIRGKGTTDIEKYICTFCTGITNVTLTSKDCGERKIIGMNELSVKTIS